MDRRRADVSNMVILRDGESTVVAVLLCMCDLGTSVHIVACSANCRCVSLCIGVV